MITTSKQIGVIGDGGWGTTLAVLLANKGYPVSLWSPFPEYARRMQSNRVNSKFLPGIPFPPQIAVTDSLQQIIEESDVIVFAIPSQYALSVIKKMKRIKVDWRKKKFLSVTKGFEHKSLQRISVLIEKEIPTLSVAVLSGPTIAGEVAKGIPSSAVIASTKKSTAKALQEIFNTSTFRIYTNTDVKGVEIGGAVKNVVALAAGICDGFGFGANTKSALVTRGLAEIGRLGKAMGAKPSTFAGLSGLGDLVTTCFSPQSRNRSVGEQLGKGKTIKQILSRMDMVAEGVETAKSLVKLSKKYHVEMPISQEVYAILYKNKSPKKVVADLMKRATKSE